MNSVGGFRVGVYIDGFNLYYGGRSIFGRSTQGWKWLDLRKLSQRLLEQQSGWPPSNDLRIVYCTARVSGAENPNTPLDQDTYIRALTEMKSVDHIEFGNFKQRISLAPLANKVGKNNFKIMTPAPPIQIQDSNQKNLDDVRFIVSVARWEEKGSDVNVGSHLLIDALQHRIDAAIVISNDSDLQFPIHEARKYIHIGIVNPSYRRTAGALLNQADAKGKLHWVYQLSKFDYVSSQLPTITGQSKKPINW